MIKSSKLLIVESKWFSLYNSFTVLVCLKIFIINCWKQNTQILPSGPVNENGIDVCLFH